MATAISPEELRVLEPDERVAVVEGALGKPLDDYAHQCHAASLALVKSGLIGPSRVARGTARGVVGQHSWLVAGDDCYASGTWLVDITRWSYDPSAPRVEVVRNDRKVHVPHGDGSIWSWGCPQSGGGPAIELVGRESLSPQARSFLDMVGPLDLEGWATLASAPVQGWEAAEILSAMHATDQLRPLLPIDRIGMLTDLNPQGLYLPDDPEEES